MKPTKKACEMTTKELAQYIDYSVLKPEFTEEDIIALTKDGVELGFVLQSVSIQDIWIFVNHMLREAKQCCVRYVTSHLGLAQQNLK